MAFDESSGGNMVMPVGPMGGYGNGGFGGFGGDNGWWIILLFVLLGGWGNGFGGYGGFGGGAGADVQRGFDQSAVMGGINGLTAAVSNGFANAEVSRCNAQTNLLQTLNTMQMAQQECCCENRAAVADLKYTISTEACADRAAGAANTQAILDKLCQLELDGVKERNTELLAENNALKFAQSQTAQDGFIQNAINQAVARVNPTPIPAYTVQNPNCCNQNYGGCGCGF